MATSFGRVEAFNEETETWERYTEHLGHYFEANGIGDENAGYKGKTAGDLVECVYS